MAFMECKIFSDVLGLSVAFNVIYPENVEKQIGLDGSKTTGAVPVLYLLHGASDDHTIWARRTSIERYVSSQGICVIMPNADLSYYTNMAHGRDYFTFISDELPAKVKQIFNVSDKREDTFVAGLSMGGYGALKIALTYPERYCAGASLSGVVDIVGQLNNWDKDRMLIVKNIFGDLEKVKGSPNDLITLLDQIKDPSGLKIFQCCGTEDFLYEGNLNFKKVIEKMNFDYHFEEGPGSHEWGYWDQMIQKVINWLPIRNRN